MEPDKRIRDKASRRELVFVAAALFLAVGFYAYDQDRTRDNNRTAILDAVSANCQTNLEQDQRFDRLIDLFVTLAQANETDTSQTPAQRAQSREFLHDFANGPKPVPCGAQRRRVEARLSD